MAREPAKICQARTDLAARLGTRYDFSPNTSSRHGPTWRYCSHWLAATRGRPPADPVERDNQRLREVNTRLEERLDTARRVIEVQGKVSALLDDLSRRAHDASEGSTPSRSGLSSPPRSSR